MSNWSPTYKAVCDICGETQEVSNYGDWACRKCGQGYTYDECHQIRLTDSQWALLRNPPQWVSVEERLPDDGQAVIVCFKGFGMDGTVGEAWFNEQHKWFSTDRGCYGASHWQPLPSPPEVE